MGGREQDLSRKTTTGLDMQTGSLPLSNVTLETAQQLQQDWRERRPLFALRDNPHYLLNRIAEETAEARAELPETDRPLTSEEQAKFGSELADILNFVLIAANHTGINLTHAFLGKLAEIEERYPEHLFQAEEGVSFEERYTEVKTAARRTMNHSGGDNG